MDFGLITVDAAGGELLLATASGSNMPAAYHAPDWGNAEPEVVFGPR